MVNKKYNTDRIRLEEIELKDCIQSGKSIVFEFGNHNNILALIERTKDNDRFENKSQNIEFMVGLKLFSEIMLKNRNNSLFEEFSPAFAQFMKKLKRNNSTE